jgi:hypothetical protein
MRTTEIDIQGLYAIAVLVTTAERLGDYLLDPEGPDTNPTSPEEPNIEMSLTCIEHAIDQLVGPDEIRQRWAAGIRQLFLARPKEFDETFNTLLRGVENFPSKWLLWNLGQDLRLVSQRQLGRNGLIKLA